MEKFYEMHNCGSEIKDTSKFCSECGVEINNPNKICPKCKSEVNISASFCDSCGYTLNNENKIKIGELEITEKLVRIIGILGVIFGLIFIIVYAYEINRTINSLSRIANKYSMVLRPMAF